LIWLSIQFGRISGYFQYPVSDRISGKADPVSGRVPVPDIKKGRIIRQDVRCVPINFFVLYGSGNSGGSYGTIGRAAGGGGMASMMDEMQKTLARRRAKVQYSPNFQLSC
jgi:hypothetical protein